MPGVRHSKREGRPVSPAATEFESATRRAIFYAKFTIGYNVIEGIVAVSAGAVAGAVSLIGFGVDSVIEVAAATVVLVRLLATARGVGVLRSTDSSASRHASGTAPRSTRPASRPASR